jgi:hypothetical protein
MECEKGSPLPDFYGKLTSAQQWREENGKAKTMQTIINNERHKEKIQIPDPPCVLCTAPSYVSKSYNVLVA